MAKWDDVYAGIWMESYLFLYVQKSSNSVVYPVISQLKERLAATETRLADTEHACREATDQHSRYQSEWEKKLTVLKRIWAVSGSAPGGGGKYG
jgi:hypothetical protein